MINYNRLVMLSRKGGRWLVIVNLTIPFQITKCGPEDTRGIENPTIRLCRYLRLCLREYCYDVFSNQLHNFYIDFGYDFYMHIRTTLPKNQVEEVVLNNHLYIRP